MIRLSLALILFLAASATSAAQSWEERIAAARQSATGIVEWAAPYGWDLQMIGTFSRDADVPVIRCLILAEMQNLPDISGYVEFWGPSPFAGLGVPEGEIDPETFEFQRLLEFASNQFIWAYQSELFLEQTEDQRAEFWELSCNGQHGIPEGLLPSAWETTASFRMDGASLYVIGDIEPGFFKEFAAVVAQNDVETVFLGSRGGSVADALDASTLIRERGFEVQLYGDCESACPFIYFGGQEPRIIYNLPVFRLGFHQISADGQAIPLDSPIYDEVGDFVTRMGVDADFVLSAMRSAAPSEMYFPDAQSLCDANAVAWIYGNCSQPFPGTGGDQ